MRINITKSANSTCFYVVKSVRRNGKSTTEVVEKLGNLEQVRIKANGADPYVWANEYAAKLTEEENSKTRKVLVAFDESAIIPSNATNKYNIGYLFLQKIYYQLGLKEICTAIGRRHEYDYDLNSILSRIVYSRILAPGSKLSTHEYSQRFLEQPNFELHQIYRALDVLSEEKDYILTALYKQSSKIVPRDTSVLYYDCTNYFFEIEEERGQCKYGHSKENRPLPIIQMGLLIDGSGIPLSFCINDGCRNEQVTLKPLEEKIINDYNLSNFIVCTDSALSSATNKFINSRKGRNFITATSVVSLEKNRKEKLLADDGWKLVGDKDPSKKYNIKDIQNSEELREKYYESTFYKEEWFVDNVDVYDDDLEKKVKRDISQRLIVTFSLKYKAYKKRLRENQVSRAIKMIKKGDSGYCHKRQNDPKNFIKVIHSTDEGVVAESTTYAIDDEAIAEEAIYDGFYGVYTSLPQDTFPVSKINSISHGRWEIEECFRILKSEFRARPVYLHKDNRIEAHFLTCFISLLILRILENKMNYKYTYCQLLSTIEDMDVCKVGDDGFIPAYTRTDVTDALHDAFNFRTDYQYLPKSSMKKIFAETKIGKYYYK